MFKKCIHIEGKCIEDVFNLPCVESVHKRVFGLIYSLVSSKMADGSSVAHIGDWLCEDYEGKYHVLSEKEYEELSD